MSATLCCFWIAATACTNSGLTGSFHCGATWANDSPKPAIVANTNSRQRRMRTPTSTASGTTAIW